MMSRFNIYTTGGELIEGSSSERSVEVDLIEELGVIPPWQACYCDPENGILIHIFTAKKRDAGTATRKANNYYAVYNDGKASQSELFDTIANELRTRLEDDMTDWERVSSKDYLKSSLSNPSHIGTVAQSSIRPTTLGERAFVSALNESDKQLRFSFECIEDLRKCVGLAVSSDIRLRYATELKSVNLDNIPLLIEYSDKTEVKNRTASLLSTRFEAIASSCLNQHTASVENSFESIEAAIDNETLRVSTAIDTLERIKSTLENRDNLTQETFHNPTLSKIWTLLNDQWTMIKRESEADVFDTFPQFDSYKSEYKSECKRALLETLQSEIELLASTH